MNKLKFLGVTTLLILFVNSVALCQQRFFSESISIDGNKYGITEDFNGDYSYNTSQLIGTEEGTDIHRLFINWDLSTLPEFIEITKVTITCGIGSATTGKSLNVKTCSSNDLSLNTDFWESLSNGTLLQTLKSDFFIDYELNISSDELKKEISEIYKDSEDNIFAIGLCSLHELDPNINWSYNIPTLKIEYKSIPDTEAPTKPTNLIGTQSGKTANLQWNRSTDDRAVEGYAIYNDGSLIKKVVRTTSYIEPNNYANVTMKGGDNNFTVKAYDAAGNYSPASDVKKMYLDNVAPTKPANFKTYEVNELSCRVSWTASTDNIGVVGYILYRDGVYHSKVYTGSPLRKHIGVSPGESHIISIRAFDEIGNLSETASVTFVTPIWCDEPLAVPANFHASEITSSSFRLNWGRVYDCIGDGVDYYVYKNGVKVAITGNSHYTLTSLSSSKTYFVKVKAVDYYGNESSTSTITVKTLTGRKAATIENEGSNLDLEQINAYPNPSKGLINVAGLNATETYKVSVINNVGQQVHSCILIDGVKQIDLTNLNEGVYLIRIENNNGNLLKSFKHFKM